MTKQRRTRSRKMRGGFLTGDVCSLVVNFFKNQSKELKTILHAKVINDTNLWNNLSPITLKSGITNIKKMFSSKSIFETALSMMSDESIDPNDSTSTNIVQIIFATLRQKQYQIPILGDSSKLSWNTMGVCEKAKVLHYIQIMRKDGGYASAYNEGPHALADFIFGEYTGQTFSSGYIDTLVFDICQEITKPTQRWVKDGQKCYYAGESSWGGGRRRKTRKSTRRRK